MCVHARSFEIMNLNCNRIRENEIWTWNHVLFLSYFNKLSFTFNCITWRFLIFTFTCGPTWNISYYRMSLYSIHSKDYYCPRIPMPCFIYLKIFETNLLNQNLFKYIAALSYVVRAHHSILAFVTVEEPLELAAGFAIAGLSALSSSASATGSCHSKRMLSECSGKTTRHTNGSCIAPAPSHCIGIDK